MESAMLLWVLHKDRGWHQADEYLILSLERYRRLFMDHLNQKPPLFLAETSTMGYPFPMTVLQTILLSSPHLRLMT